MMVFAQADDIGKRVAAALRPWDDVVVVLNGTVAEQAGPALRSKYSVLYTALAVQRSFLVLPPPDIGVFHRHEGKGIEFQHHLRDGENFPHFV